MSVIDKHTYSSIIRVQQSVDVHYY